MRTGDHLLPGFSEPVDDAQRVFRAALGALSRPGSIHALDGLPAPPAPFNPVAAALILALADHETRVWLDEALVGEAAVSAYVRFHTGATIVGDPASSTFAAVSDPARMPPLAAFAKGSLQFPDRSTTVIMQVAHLESGRGHVLSGAGIEDTCRLAAAPLPAGFVAQMAENRALFPCGVDLLLAGPATMAGLPRTTVIRE